MNKVRWIPNAVTLGNLALGFVSLLLTMDGMRTEAAYAIFGAMILDSMDGRLARRLHVVSDLGKELDSLSDLVSFGVAPALLTYASQLHHFGNLGLVLAIGFALCGAYRLARFNVINVKTYFIGVPITFCGPLLTLLVLLHKWIDFRFYPVFTVVLAYLMVCNLKVPKI